MTWLRQWLAAWLSKRERAAPDACPAFALRIPADHPPLDDTPDHPADFGLKTCWLAVKIEEPERVLTLLKAQDVRRANWQNGIHVAYWASRKKYQASAWCNNIRNENITLSNGCEIVLYKAGIALYYSRFLDLH